jgi:hypothetical protein
MNRLLIPVAALLGVVLGWLLIPSPDTGKPVPTWHPHASAAAADVEAAATDAAEEPAPGRNPVGLRPVPGGAAALDGMAGSMPQPGPEVAQASRAVAAWSRIKRRLDLRTDDAAASAAATDVDAMVQTLKTYRTDPSSGDWAALAQQQTDLIGRIRGLGGNDPTIETSLVRVEQALSGDEPAADAPLPGGVPIGPPGAMPIGLKSRPLVSPEIP